MVEEVIANVSGGLAGAYSAFAASLPGWAERFISLFILILVIFVYALIVWAGYRFLSKKDPLGLDLSRYNRSNHPVAMKLIAGLIYFLEYIVIAPIMIFVSFSIFTILVTFLTQTLSIEGILLVSAGIIGAIRMAAYYSEDLSREIAKFLPLTLLGIAVLNPGFFDVTRVLGEFARLPELFGDIGIYLVFILLLEFIMRLFDLFFSLLGINGNEKSGEED